MNEYGIKRKCSLCWQYKIGQGEVHDPRCMACEGTGFRTEESAYDRLHSYLAALATPGSGRINEYHADPEKAAMAKALLVCLEALSLDVRSEHREDDYEVCFDWCPACKVESAREALDKLAMVVEANRG